MKNAAIFHGTGGNPGVYWIPWLKAELEKQGYKVTVPALPDPDNPDIKVHLPFVLNNVHFDEDTVLIGHSSGAPLILSVLENIEPKIKKAILVAGFYKPLPSGRNNELQDSYDWGRIKTHAESFTFINSDNDPWGCDDQMGREMQQHLGGELIVMHDGHMGSDSFNQPYREFPMLVEIIDKDSKQ
jgi:predicted alpha/beta hydrolase family esterase